MSDYTINDTMADIRYDLDDREIYNDARAELGFQTTETITDSNPTYGWKRWSRYRGLPSPGCTMFVYFTATIENPIAWKLNVNHSAYDYDYNPYYDYAISLENTDDPKCKAVKITNTGSKGGTISFAVEYKYKISDTITHEETSYDTVSARAVGAVSTRKYGRRVMNLVWPQGLGESEMQSLVEQYITKYAEPVARLTVTMMGTTPALIAIIQGCEISNTVDVTCDNLGLTATTFYINRIQLSGDPAGIPKGVLVLEQQRNSEAPSLFTLDTSELDGPDTLG